MASRALTAEIQQRQFELVLVGHHRWQRRRENRISISAPGPSERCQQIGHAARPAWAGPAAAHPAPGGGRRPACAGSAWRRAARPAWHCPAGATAAGSSGSRLLQQLQAAQDRHQQIVEIVRHAAGELADGIHLLRLKQRLARLFQRFLGLLALGDVARDLGEADAACRRRRGSDRSPHAPRSGCRPCAPASLPSRSGLRGSPSPARAAAGRRRDPPSV